jgi:predicted RNase H-like HicB family nuclease
MRKEAVEIYSDATNQAVLKHPGRRFPGVLIQGDTLHSLLMQLKAVRMATAFDPDTAIVFDEAIEQLTDYVEHYEEVLAEHGVELPYPKVK